MNPKDLKLGEKYICQDFGLLEYSKPLSEGWHLFLFLDEKAADLYGDQTAYDDKDVLEAVRELTKLDRKLMGID
jgi:hypothetical protein